MRFLEQMARRQGKSGIFCYLVLDLELENYDCNEARSKFFNSAPSLNFQAPRHFQSWQLFVVLLLHFMLIDLIVLVSGYYSSFRLDTVSGTAANKVRS